jgi:hypothetical protein
MVTLVVVLAVLTIGVVLVRELLVGLSEYRRRRGTRQVIAREQLRAEQQLHQLTQDAVARMLEAARHR